MQLTLFSSYVRRPIYCSYPIANTITTAATGNAIALTIIPASSPCVTPTHEKRIFLKYSGAGCSKLLSLDQTTRGYISKSNKLRTVVWKIFSTYCVIRNLLF